MIIVDNIASLEEISGDISIAIGNFDGVHLGHQKLLENFINLSSQKRLTPVLITFNPHPNLFFKGIHPFLITDRSEKLEIIKNIGLEHIVELEFNKDLQQMSPEDFIDNMLLAKKIPALIYLGHDFKIGRGKINALELLKEKTKNSNITILEEEAYKVDNEILSSSSIREKIQAGVELSKIPRYLGRNFSVSGIVKKGRGIGGRELVHTANLSVSADRMFPPLGVYITETIVDGLYYESVTNVGVNPTVSDQNIIEIEVHLLYVDKDLYGKKIEVIFKEKIRDERKFPNKDALLTQIKLDIDTTKDYFRKKSKIHLALIGKNISHSRSQFVYEKILGKSINYELIDVSEDHLPDLKSLRAKYSGVSITAPYKKHYLSQIENQSNLSMINAISFEADKFIGANTDSLALNEIIQRYLKTDIENIIILGDGNMSSLLVEILVNNKFSNYKVLSRKLGNLDEIDGLLSQNEYRSLVINSCSRDFCFKLPSFDRFNFWDLNYSLEHHSQLFLKSHVKYSDGMEMLELQAKYALSFWNLKTS